MIQPLFDSPSFPLKTDTGSRNYGNVRNLLSISPARGRSAALIPIEVPTALFPIMSRLGVPVDSVVTLYLDEARSGYVFGIEIDGSEIFDLWVYHESKLPSWITSL